MSENISVVDYFYVEVADKPGEGARMLDHLRGAGVNLLVFSGFPRGRRAQIDVVPDDTRKFHVAVRKAKLAFNPKKTGFLIQGDDRPGALADHLRRLAEKGVNVTAVDGLSAGKGRWGAILWVKLKDIARAGRLLRAKAK